MTAPAVHNALDLAGEVVDQTEKDWTYLLEKEPSSNHILFAKIMREKLGDEAVDNATPEQMIYWLLAMHRWMQKTEANRERAEFRGRTWGSVLKGYETLAERASLEDSEAAVAEPVALTIETPAPKRTRRAPAKAEGTPAPRRRTRKAAE